MFNIEKNASEEYKMTYEADLFKTNEGKLTLFQQNGVQCQWRHYLPIL